MDAAAKVLSKQVSVRAFARARSPRSPDRQYRRHFVLRTEAIRESLPTFTLARRRFAHRPDRSARHQHHRGEEEGQLTFEAEVEVRPEISIKANAKLRVTIPSRWSRILRLTSRSTATSRRRRAQSRRPADCHRRPRNDDVHVQQIATEAEPLDMTDFMYTVGTGSIAEGIDELILGLKAGEDLKMNAPVGEALSRPTS